MIISSEEEENEVIDNDDSMTIYLVCCLCNIVVNVFSNTVTFTKCK